MKRFLHDNMAWGLTLLALLPTDATARFTDRYVVKDNPNAAPPYACWETAAPDIQTAVDAAIEGDAVIVRSSAGYPALTQRAYRAPGDTVWVRAGVYDTGGRPSGRWRSQITNRVAITKAITVRSEHNDPENTIIKGAWDPVATNGPAAVRPVYIADGATLIGFTLIGGATYTTNQPNIFNMDMIGGGVLAESSRAMVSNCIIAGNASFGDPRQSGESGGGVMRGTYRDCVIRDNHTVLGGGGAAQAMLFNTVLAGNRAGRNGGGASGGFLSHCLVVGNRADGIGGGVYSARMEDCLLVGNRAELHGGGYGLTDPILKSHARLLRCTVAYNVSDRAGGGVRGAYVRDSLILRNTASIGDGLFQCVVSDSVLLFNGSGRSRFDNCLLVASGISPDLPTEQGVAIRASTVVGAPGAGINAAGEGVAVRDTISWGNARPDTGVRAERSIGVEGPANNYAADASDNLTAFAGFRDPGEGFGAEHVLGDYRLPDAASTTAGARLGERMNLRDGIVVPSPRVRVSTATHARLRELIAEHRPEADWVIDTMRIEVVSKVL